jgi:hypothetical protein
MIALIVISICVTAFLITDRICETVDNFSEHNSSDE